MQETEEEEQRAHIRHPASMGDSDLKESTPEG